MAELELREKELKVSLPPELYLRMIRHKIETGQPIKQTVELALHDYFDRLEGRGPASG